MNIQSKNKLFHKKDLILILIFVLISVIFILFQNIKSDDKLYGKIYCDGELVKTVCLSDVTNDDYIELKNGKVIIHIMKNGISFEKSDCKNQLCVNCGVIDKNGESAVCIPENVVITVEGNYEKDSVDIVSY